MVHPRLSIGCALILLTSCASNGFIASWRAPDATPLQISNARVGAVVMMSDEASRRVAEDALAREIDARGGQGIPAYTVMPDSRPATEAEARAAFESSGVQGIVVLRPVSVDEELVASSVTYLDARYGAYWGGYYGYGWNNPWAQPARIVADVHTNTIVTIETLVYSLRQNKLVWAGQSRSTNARNVEALVKKVATAAAMELQKQGLLGSSKSAALPRAHRRTAFWLDDDDAFASDTFVQSLPTRRPDPIGRSFAELPQ